MNTVLDMCWLDSLEFVDGLEVAYSFKVMAGFKAVDSLDAINRLIYIKFIEIEVVLLTALLTVSFRLILRYIRQKDPELYLPADPRLSILVLYFGVTIILLSGLYSPIETVIFSVLLLYLSIMSFTDYYTGLVYPVFSYFYLLIGVSLWLFKYLVYDRNSTTMVIGLSLIHICFLSGGERGFCAAVYGCGVTDSPGDRVTAAAGWFSGAGWTHPAVQSTGQ